MVVIRRLPNGQEIRVDGKTLPSHTMRRIKTLFAWHIQHGGIRPNRVVLSPDGSVTLQHHAKAGDNGESEKVSFIA